jgi:hypothetical protein
MRAEFWKVSYTRLLATRRRRLSCAAYREQRKVLHRETPEGGPVDRHDAREFAVWAAMRLAAGAYTRGPSVQRFAGREGATACSRSVGSRRRGRRQGRAEFSFWLLGASDFPNEKVPRSR